MDYWSADFDFENRRKTIRVQKIGEFEEPWTGDSVFEDKWSGFRTKSNRSLEPISVVHECPPEQRKLAVKAVDIFINDTMAVVRMVYE